MRSDSVCLCVLIASLSVAAGGCTGKSSGAGQGGSVGTAAGGAGDGGSSGGDGSGGAGAGPGGAVGTGGGGPSGSSSAGGTQGVGGASADASGTSLGDGSVGCGVAGAPTGNLSGQSIQVGDRTRTYALTVPKGYTPSTPLPVVFAWHGMGGSGSIARSYFHLDSAIANRAIVVYPDGLPVGDGGTGWDLTAAGIDVAFFDALLAYVSDNYCIDRNRVFSTGHSYGGFFTNALGCYRGDVLRAIAPVAGMPPTAYGRNTVTCAGKVAALVIHGENDPTVDYARGGEGGRDFWIAQNGCSSTDAVAITPAACLEYQSCQPDLPVVFCTHTEGHDWPTANGSGCSAGGVCFDAGSIIWTFFSRFE
jgi:polyhydroxybutyrate depolymerase